MIISGEYSWIFEMTEDDKIQALENFVKDEVFRNVKEYYKENSLPVAGPEPPARNEPEVEAAPEMDLDAEAP